MVDLARQRNTVFQKEKYHKRMQVAKELLGGHCIVCGSVEDLQFDHIDPYNKSFAITSGCTKTLDVFLQEVRKCQLLCTSCHKLKSEVDGSRCKRTENTLRGDQHPNAKLTPNQVREILENTRKLSLRGLAEQYGVSRGLISHIRAGRSWVHVTAVSAMG